MPDQREIQDFLSKISGFSDLTPEDLERLSDRTRVLEFAAGDFLFRRGDPGDAMYVIHQGRVHVPLAGPDGAPRSVVLLGPTDLVGEMALLTGEPRSADVIADTDVVALSIDRVTLGGLLDVSPPLARFLTHILADRLEAAGGIQQVGKYRLLGIIGEGASSRVYEAVHPDLGRVVAIKMLDHELSHSRRFRERFLEEARTVASLIHPNIVQVYDSELRYGTWFIIMEKVKGQDLGRILLEREVLPAPEAMGILRQVALALSHAHAAGIVHRDVKPANCAVDAAGNVKLMDFRLAYNTQAASGERTATVDGTPNYMSPEAAMGLPLDGAADVYSLAVMAFEMVTGRLPFEGPSAREVLVAHVRQAPPDVSALAPGLPVNLVTFINGGLAKRREERLVDWQVIDRLLAEPLGGRAVEAPQTDVITIRYPRAAEDPVSAAILELAASLAEIDGVEVSQGRVSRLH